MNINRGIKKCNIVKIYNLIKEETECYDQSTMKRQDAIIEQYGRKPASLIPIMQDIQAEYRYLPESC